MKFNEYQQCVSNMRRVKLAFIYIRNVRCFHSKRIWGRGKRQWNYSGRNIHTSKQRHLCEWFKEKSKDITCFDILDFDGIALFVTIRFSTIMMFQPFCLNFSRSISRCMLILLYMSFQFTMIIIM